MVVEFVPDKYPGNQPRDEQENLAEIIELRGRLGGYSRRSTDERPQQRSLEHARQVLSLAEQRKSSDNSDGLESLTSDEVSDARHGTAVEHGTTSGGREIPLEDRDAYTEAVRILARKQLSEVELKHELLKREHDPRDVEQVVYEFIDRLYLDDEALARALSESLRERKHSSRAEIARKLHQRFIDRTVIDTVISEIDLDSENTLLHEAAQGRARRLLGLDRETAERRLLGFLARRGWQGEAARNAARQALDESGIGTRGSVRFR